MILKTPPQQPSLTNLNLEEILPLELVKVHCKIDDLPGITDMQLELYREAAFDAAERITGKKWAKREKIEQDIVSPNYRNIAQAAIARIIINLSYLPIDGIVNVHSSGDNINFWSAGDFLPFYRHPTFYTLQLPPGRQFFEMSNDVMFASSGAIFGCAGMGGSNFQQVGSSCSYLAGPKCVADIPAGIKLGCLKYIAWSVENPGDQFVPMVVRQVGVTTVSNDPAFSSGAIDEWRRYKPRIAR